MEEDEGRKKFSKDKLNLAEEISLIEDFPTQDTKDYSKNIFLKERKRKKNVEFTSEDEFEDSNLKKKKKKKTNGFESQEIFSDSFDESSQGNKEEEETEDQSNLKKKDQGFDEFFDGEFSENLRAEEENEELEYVSRKISKSCIDFSKRCIQSNVNYILSQIDPKQVPKVQPHFERILSQFHSKLETSNLDLPLVNEVSYEKVIQKFIRTEAKIKWITERTETLLTQIELSEKSIKELKDHAESAKNIESLGLLRQMRQKSNLHLLLSTPSELKAKNEKKKVRLPSIVKDSSDEFLESSLNDITKKLMEIDSQIGDYSIYLEAISQVKDRLNDLFGGEL